MSFSSRFSLRLSPSLALMNVSVLLNDKSKGSVLSCLRPERLVDERPMLRKPYFARARRSGSLWRAALYAGRRWDMVFPVKSAR